MEEVTAVTCQGQHQEEKNSKMIRAGQIYRLDLNAQETSTVKQEVLSRPQGSWEVHEKLLFHQD